MSNRSRRRRVRRRRRTRLRAQTKYLAQLYLCLCDIPLWNPCRDSVAHTWYSGRMKWLTRIFSGSNAEQNQLPRIFFTNRLSGAKELFISQKPGIVSLYTCGPTVYSQQHIGNLRAAVFSDTLARVLMGAGFRVHRVINITDVGHLVGDGDYGEDKMTVGATREHTTPETIAKRYTKMYMEDLGELNIDTDTILFPHAT